MKTIEKFVGVNLSDLDSLIPNLKSAANRIMNDYKQTTHPKLKMLDALIIFSLVTFIAQIVYANVIVRSRDPFNSYLAGVFCSLGQFALAGKSSHHQFAECFSSLSLFELFMNLNLL